MIIHGNCVDIMAEMDAESVDLVVTSPPYDDLRAYNGYQFDAREVLAELLRVVKPGGVVIWNVADRVKDGSRTLTSYRQALVAQELGFLVNDVMIWRKSNPLPGYQGPRYTNSFEYMFVFSKGRPATFNALTEPCSTAGAAVSNSYGGEHRQPERNYKVKAERPRRNIWDYSTASHRSRDELGHSAAFPLPLAEDHIRSWSNPGDLVLDPMCGSGTTLVAAKRLGREFIGIDISEEYCELAKRRLDEELV